MCQHSCTTRPLGDTRPWGMQMVWEQPTWKDIFFQGKVISAAITECSCSNTLAARKEAFTQALSWTNFSTTVSICLGANNLPDSSLDLLFAERSLCSVFHQPNAAGDVYPGPKSCTLWPYRERVERLFVSLCLAVFLNIRFTEIHNGGKILPQT